MNIYYLCFSRFPYSQQTLHVRIIFLSVKYRELEISQSHHFVQFSVSIGGSGD